MEAVKVLFYNRKQKMYMWDVCVIKVLYNILMKNSAFRIRLPRYNISFYLFVSDHEQFKSINLSKIEKNCITYLNFMQN